MAENNSKTQIQEAFDTCKTELRDAIERLMRAKEDRKQGWKHFKRALGLDKLKNIILKLHRKCQIIQNLIGIHTAALTAKTYVETKETKKEHQGWHSMEQNRRVSEWLSRLDFKEKQRDFLGIRHPGTESGF
jgi:hypothetical protein